MSALIEISYGSIPPIPNDIKHHLQLNTSCLVLICVGALTAPSRTRGRCRGKRFPSPLATHDTHSAERPRRIMAQY